MTFFTQIRFGCKVAMLGPMLFVMHTAFACEVSLAYADSPSAPFLMGGDQTVPDKAGIAVDIAKVAVARTKCTLTLTRLPGQRALREVEEGDFDGAIMFSYEQDRAQRMVYPTKGAAPDTTRRLATLRYFLYRQKGSKISWDGTVLTNPGALPIGINYGFSVRELLTNLGAKVEEVKTTEQNLGKLQLGRIGGYAMQEHIADAMIHNLHLENDIEKLPVPLLTKDYFLAFSNSFYRTHPELAEQIWAVIADKRDALTHELLSQYATK